MSRDTLYPPLSPYQTDYLAVDDLHKLYWEQSGNPEGVPVLFLHGGPGAGASATHRRFFDPAHYRIIIMDQRGAGRSRPLGETRENTTAHLVSDIERLRHHLKISRWHVFGGSWGSTLALAYAQKHPGPVLSLVLRGIFMMRAEEIDWFFNQMGRVFPEAHDAFTSPLGKNFSGDLLEAWSERLNSDNEHIRLEAARVWSMYEGSCSTLLPNPDLLAVSGDDTHALGLARIEAHYFRNCRFEPEDKILRDVERIRHIPAVIVQGRYDMVCPAKSAWELHRAWPEAEFIMVPDAGHSAMEPGICRALIHATDRFRLLDATAGARHERR